MFLKPNVEILVSKLSNVVLAQAIFRLSILTLLAKESSQHGYLQEPAARNCAWRFGFKTPENFDDNGLNCGGFAHQWFTNEGKCGVCGDNYSGPRQHEVGGLYATGTIVQSYEKGQVIDITILVTANHLGTMELRICPTNSKLVEATKECLDKHVLEIIGYGSSYPVREGERIVKMKVKLPENVSCSHCVMQWKYRAGNSWGSDLVKTGVGVGPQEEFYNCADIEIKSDFESNTSYVPDTVAPTTTKQIDMNLFTLVATTELVPDTTTEPIDSHEENVIVETTTWSIFTEFVLDTTEVPLAEEEAAVETTDVSFETTTPSITEPPLEITTTGYVKEAKIENSEAEFRCKRLPVEWAAIASRKRDPNEFYGMPVCYLIGRTRLKCKDCYENCITPLKDCPRKDCFCKWYPDL